MQPKVSVIIPFLNGLPYLEECVRSVQQQTLRDIEIILVDDGSSDGSEALADTFAAEDDRICVIHQENAGLSGARNSGIEIARGSYIGFVDGDDVIHPRMYELLVSAAEELSCELVTCGHQSFCESKTYATTVPSIPIRQRTEPDAVRAYMPQFCADGSLMYVWRRLYAASLFREKGIRFDTRLRICEDATFCMECMLRANGITAIAEPLYRYRVVKDSLIRSKKYNPNMTDCMILQYEIKKNFSADFSESLHEQTLCALADYTFRHISYLVFRNLYRNRSRAYSEFRKAARSVLFRDMFRYFDIKSKRSRSLDWVMLRLIELRLYLPAYLLGKKVY